MNIQQILLILKQFGMPILQSDILPLVSVQLIMNPTMTDAEIITLVDGKLKHYARTKVGWLIDFEWPFTESEIDTLIGDDIPQARAALAAAASSSAPIPTPAPVPSIPISAPSVVSANAFPAGVAPTVVAPVSVVLPVNSAGNPPGSSAVEAKVAGGFGSAEPVKP